jgi:hypothetical protein
MNSSRLVHSRSPAQIMVNNLLYQIDHKDSLADKWRHCQAGFPDPFSCIHFYGEAMDHYCPHWIQTIE